jgi:hypothetical protein
MRASIPQPVLEQGQHAGRLDIMLVLNLADDFSTTSSMVTRPSVRRTRRRRWRVKPLGHIRASRSSTPMDSGTKAAFGQTLDGARAGGISWALNTS